MPFPTTCGRAFTFHNVGLGMSWINEPKLRSLLEATDWFERLWKTYLIIKCFHTCNPQTNQSFFQNLFFVFFVWDEVRIQHIQAYDRTMAISKRTDANLRTALHLYRVWNNLERNASVESFPLKRVLIPWGAGRWTTMISRRILKGPESFRRQANSNWRWSPIAVHGHAHLRYYKMLKWHFSPSLHREWSDAFHPRRRCKQEWNLALSSALKQVTVCVPDATELKIVLPVRAAAIWP